jgi:outer membrane protein TolC
MMMLRIFALVISFLSCALTFSAHAEMVDLEKAERLALENNLNLRAQAFYTRASEALVRKGYGIYDPRAHLYLAGGESRERLNLQFFGAESEIEYRQFDFSLTQKIPTGAELSAGFTNRREKTFSQPQPLIDPSYGSELKFTLVQPLLKGFGRTVTEEQIFFAIKDHEAAIQDLREKAFQLLAQVRDAYFDVLSFRDNLAYRQASVKLARKVLEENQARVETGFLPPIEVLEAEVGLKLRERELLDTWRAYDDALDHFALLLNLEEKVDVADEALGQPALDADENEGYRFALVKRPDLLRRIQQIERLTLEGKVARNQLMPDLNLSASYSHKGLGEDYNEDLDEVASSDLKTWEVGVALSYPLGNREARNEYLKTEIRLKGDLAQLAQLRQEIRKEIRAAIRLLDVSEKKIEVSRLGKDLAEEKLRTLLERREVGLATTRQVLEGEEDLARAQTDRIAALAAYNKAVTEYLKVTGLLLEREGVHFINPSDTEEDIPPIRMDQK